MKFETETPEILFSRKENNIYQILHYGLNKCDVILKLLKEADKNLK